MSDKDIVLEKYGRKFVIKHAEPEPPASIKEHTVPMEQWARDHWSTLAYIGLQIVNEAGKVDRRRMRCDVDLHPGFAHSGSYGKKYPTRLKDGTERERHDDWSCVDDFIDHGLVEWNGTGINPVFTFTDDGWALWYEFQKHIAENPKSWSATFTPARLKDSEAT